MQIWLVLMSRIGGRGAYEYGMYTCKRRREGEGERAHEREEEISYVIKKRKEKKRI